METSANLISGTVQDDCLIVAAALQQTLADMYLAALHIIRSP